MQDFSFRKKSIHPFGFLLQLALHSVGLAIVTPNDLTTTLPNLPLAPQDIAFQSLQSRSKHHTDNSRGFSKLGHEYKNILQSIFGVSNQFPFNIAMEENTESLPSFDKEIYIHALEASQVKPVTVKHPKTLAGLLHQNIPSYSQKELDYDSLVSRDVHVALTRHDLNELATQTSTETFNSLTPPIYLHYPLQRHLLQHVSDSGKMSDIPLHLPNIKNSGSYNGDNLSMFQRRSTRSFDPTAFIPNAKMEIKQVGSSSSVRKTVNFPDRPIPLGLSKNSDNSRFIPIALPYEGRTFPDTSRGIVLSFSKLLSKGVPIENRSKPPTSLKFPHEVRRRSDENHFHYDGDGDYFASWNLGHYRKTVRDQLTKPASSNQQEKISIPTYFRSASFIPESKTIDEGIGTPKYRAGGERFPGFSDEFLTTKGRHKYSTLDENILPPPPLKSELNSIKEEKKNDEGSKESSIEYAAFDGLRTSGGEDMKDKRTDEVNVYSPDHFHETDFGKGKENYDPSSPEPTGDDFDMKEYSPPDEGPNYTSTEGYQDNYPVNNNRTFVNPLSNGPYFKNYNQEYGFRYDFSRAQEKVKFTNQNFDVDGNVIPPKHNQAFHNEKIQPLATLPPVVSSAEPPVISGYADSYDDGLSREQNTQRTNLETPDVENIPENVPNEPNKLDDTLLPEHISKKLTENTEVEDNFPVSPPYQNPFPQHSTTTTEAPSTEADNALYLETPSPVLPPVIPAEPTIRPPKIIVHPGPLEIFNNNVQQTSKTSVVPTSSSTKPCNENDVSRQSTNNDIEQSELTNKVNIEQTNFPLIGRGENYGKGSPLTPQTTTEGTGNTLQDVTFNSFVEYEVGLQKGVSEGRNFGSDLGKQTPVVQTGVAEGRNFGGPTSSDPPKPELYPGGQDPCTQCAGLHPGLGDSWKGSHQPWHYKNWHKHIPGPPVYKHRPYGHGYWKKFPWHHRPSYRRGHGHYKGNYGHYDHYVHDISNGHVHQQPNGTPHTPDKSHVIYSGPEENPDNHQDHDHNHHDHPHTDTPGSPDAEHGCHYHDHGPYPYGPYPEPPYFKGHYHGSPLSPRPPFIKGHYHGPPFPLGPSPIRRRFHSFGYHHGPPHGPYHPYGHHGPYQSVPHHYGHPPFPGHHHKPPLYHSHYITSHKPGHHFPPYGEDHGSRKPCLGHLRLELQNPQDQADGMTIRDTFGNKTDGIVLEGPLQMVILHNGNASHGTFPFGNGYQQQASENYHGTLKTDTLHHVEGQNMYHEPYYPHQVQQGYENRLKPHVTTGYITRHSPSPHPRRLYKPMAYHLQPRRTGYSATKPIPLRIKANKDTSFAKPIFGISRTMSSSIRVTSQDGDSKMLPLLKS